MAEQERSSWKTETVVAALVIVGGLGVWLGRCSRSVKDVEAKASEPQSAWTPAAPSGSTASAPVGSGVGLDKDEPQKFDLTEIPQAKAGVPLRPMDRDIFAALADPHLDRAQMVDLFPKRPYKVRIAGSAAEHRFGLVLIDMNRDDKMDERWELKGSDVIRKVSHDPNAGDEPVEYTLRHGRWQAR